ncbi:MAG: polyhydroxyalkanoate depolymerase [Hyphomicrobiaceae bacterium]|nr:polyhydroxyalkanoate depolymerase [Hyphomicrobiaceae bacterium]MCC0011003.1 polyhydroxyalkanoate depolymerase [Hyphomicrobiaceae bacterium]
MHYHAYEMAHVMMSPARLMNRAMKLSLDFPLNPFSKIPPVRMLSAACGVFESLTRRYGKPDFAIEEVMIEGRPVGVQEQIAARRTFCNLLHFIRDPAAVAHRNDPPVLLVAPLSGHYATLLRGTVRELLAHHDVYITDWVDARDVPLHEGDFGLDDFIDYLKDFISLLGPGSHVIAVCQPAVPALAATALMAEDEDPVQPASLTLMGGPIDTRINPTIVNRLAEQRSLTWFEHNIIARVPFPNAGFMRKVYPGFLQLTGFMSMNLERHATAHVDLFHDLIKGDEDSVRQHNQFYEEYLAVMDLPERFYLDTIERVFQQHALPEAAFRHRGRLVDCRAIRNTALFTIEGERDDICGLGQTSAAHRLCPNIPEHRRQAYVQKGVGHYGVFNGSRFRRETRPRITDWINTMTRSRPF